MGNPAPHSRSNSPKSNVKPKHRHSGSASNISFTSEDAKPKHRHSGSVSSISLTQEDLKPRHRPIGSVSNISIIPIAPEDLKDFKPKHRRSGSVSSGIITNAEDFTSPSRGSVSRSSSPSSSGPSASSAVSLKEKRNKRRTRSSLGGTEDFVKELDFLATPSPNGRTPDSTSSRKELLKPSPSPSLPELVPSEAAAEALTPIPEAFVSVQEKVSDKSPAPIDQPNDLVVEKANVIENGAYPCVEKSFVSANVGDSGGPPPHGEKSVSSVNVSENGGSPHDEKSVSLAEAEIVQPGHASHLAESESEGADRGSTVTVGTSRADHHSESDGERILNVLDKSPSTLENGSNGVDHEVLVEISPILENGQLPETAAGLLLVGTVTQEFDRNEPVDVRINAEEAPESIVERGLPTESLVAVTAIPSPGENTNKEAFMESDCSEPSVTGGIIKSFADEDSQVSPSEDEKLSQEEQAAKATQEEKVSVQKRIEELEKISGGRPVHFRSQSLSLPRPFDVSHARHHEAEVSKGCKLPVYKAPLDSTSVSELGSTEFVGMSHEELNHGSLERGGLVSTDGRLPATGLDVDETSEQETKSQEVHAISEAHIAVDVSPSSMGPHPENGTTSYPSESLRANEADRTTEPLIDGVAEAHDNAVEQEQLEIGKEKGLESGLRETYVKDSADSVPKELHTRAPAGDTKENDGKLEVVEPPAGVLKSQTTREAHQMGTSPEVANTGMLPVALQRGTLTGVPSVQASITEQSSQDYETTMLLTKQPAVDPLFIDSQQDRLWEMHSQELAIGESSGQEVRESSAQDDDPRQYLNGTHSHAEVMPSDSAANGNPQSDKSSKVDRPRTPLRSLLAEEDAEKSPDSGRLGTPPQNQSVSPRGNLFKRIVSGGKNSPTKQTTPSKFSPKNQTAAKPFLSSCMCCSVK